MTDLLLASLLAGLAALDRKGVAQLFVSRPLVLCAAIGAAGGDLMGGLGIGLCLELIYLGGVNLGAALPENEVVASSCVAAAAVFAGRALGGMAPSIAALALLLAAPAGLLGRGLDRWSERLNDVFAQRARDALETGAGVNAARWNLAGLALPFGATTLATLAAGALGPELAGLHQRLPAGALRGLEYAWSGALGLGLAAALFAARARSAPIWAAGAAVAVALVGWAVGEAW